MDTSELVKGEGYNYVGGVLLGIACLGWSSLISEVRQPEPPKSQQPSKDRNVAWDIAKFVLISCVTLQHSHVFGPGSVVSDLVVGATMPGFFIISGVFSSGGDALLSGKEVRHVLQTNILNGILVGLVFWAFAAVGRSPKYIEPPLWFLNALAACRLVIAPAFRATRSFMGRSGTWLFVAVLVLAFALQSQLPMSWPSRSQADTNYMCFFLHWSICEMVNNARYYPLYALGMCMSRELLDGWSVNAVTSCLSLTLSACLMVANSKYITYTGFVNIYDHADCPPEVYVTRVALDTALILGILLNCLVLVRFAPASAVSLLAAAGSRTLYGYILQMVLFTFFDWSPVRLVFQDIATRSKLCSVCSIAIFTASLCSPIAKSCFAWMVEPGWILENVVVRK